MEIYITMVLFLSVSCRSWKSFKLYVFIITHQAFQVAQTLKNLPAIRETQVRSLGWGDPLKKGIAAYSSILAWEIPWAEEAGRLQFMGGRKELDMIEQQF